MAPPGRALSLGLLFFPGLFLLTRAALRGPCGHVRAEILAARLVSSVQAVLASSAGYVISSSCKHVIDDQHWLARSYPEFAVPYFVYDVVAMFLCHRHRRRLKGHEDDEEEEEEASSLRSAAASYLRRDLLMVLHHLVMVLVCFPVANMWRQDKGDFFLGCLLMAELSTPFVCLGKVLILFQLQHTRLYKANALALLVTFFLCRVLLFPYLYGAYASHHGLSLLEVPGALPPLYNVGAALLLAPQLYWFLLICRGAWRLFRRPRQPP